MTFDVSEEWDQNEEETIPLEIPDQFARLAAEEQKLTAHQLWKRYLDREIVLEPDFQRHYVWDTTRASRYIESLLLRLPTPALFLSEESDGRWIVIDGHQRLETLFRFMQPLLSGVRTAEDKKSLRYTAFSPLTLRSLEVIPQFDGKGVLAFETDDRARLWDSELTVIIIPRDSHPDIKYALFARLNQGSMSLNNQELRNCLYRGAYNALIGRLSEDSRFLHAWGRNAPDKRMRHRELALRFFALLHRIDRYRVPFRNFLNDEMEANRDLTHVDQTRCRLEFERGLTWVERVFDKEGFRLFRLGDSSNPAGRWDRRLDLIYEVEMVAFAQFGDSLEETWLTVPERQRHLFVSALRGRLINVMANPEFLETLNQSTTRPATVRKRFELWNNGLDSTLKDPNGAVERATFLHQRLRESNVCAQCPQQVAIDDAVLVSVDGVTRVAHRSCQRNQHVVHSVPTGR